VKNSATRRAGVARRGWRRAPGPALRAGAGLARRG